MSRASAKASKAETSRMIHVRLDASLHRRLRMIVAAEDTSVQDWATSVVAKAVSEQWPKLVRDGDQM